MKHRWTVLLLCFAACTAEARCDPTLSFGGTTEVAADAGAVTCTGCRAVHVSAGASHGCVTLEDPSGGGEVRCWGANEFGQVLARPTELDVIAPARPELPRRELLQVPARTSAGGLGTCATFAGVGGCWGTNAAAAIGGSLVDSPFSTWIGSERGELVTVEMGAAHACSMNVGGIVRCAGDNAFQQLGVSRDFAYSGQQFALISLEPLRALAVGPTVSCGVVIEGDRLDCWGRFDDSLRTPPLLAGLPDRVTEGVHRVAVGSDRVCVANDDAVSCLGQISGVSFGFPMAGVTALCVGGLRPAEVRSAVEIEYGPPSPSHVCAQSEELGLLCWGDNSRGQLGYGRLGAELPPSRVPLDDVEAIACGGAHTCAIADGELWCWGDNSRGQLARDPAEIELSVEPLRIELP